MICTRFKFVLLLFNFTYERHVLVHVFVGHGELISYTNIRFLSDTFKMFSYSCTIPCDERLEVVLVGLKYIYFQKHNSYRVTYGTSSVFSKWASLCSRAVISPTAARVLLSIGLVIFLQAWISSSRDANMKVKPYIVKLPFARISLISSLQKNATVRTAPEFVVYATEERIVNLIPVKGALRNMRLQQIFSEALLFMSEEQIEDEQKQEKKNKTQLLCTTECYLEVHVLPTDAKMSYQLRCLWSTDERLTFNVSSLFRISFFLASSLPRHMTSSLREVRY